MKEVFCLMHKFSEEGGGRWRTNMCGKKKYGVTEHTESSDLLSVLDQLDSDALSNGGVGLLGLDTDLLEHDSLGV
jgi:hypothetical protein